MIELCKVPLDRLVSEVARRRRAVQAPPRAKRFSECPYCSAPYGVMDLRSHKPRCKQKPINVLPAKRKNLKRGEIATMKATNDSQSAIEKTQQREAAKQKLIAQLRQQWPGKTHIWIATKAERELAHSESQSS